MDFDGDGIPDVLSGSYPGELYFFKGLGKGKYAPSQQIKGKDGKPINTGYASTVFAADWRGTGKLDLLVGSIEGFVWLVPNEGTKEKPAFGKPVKLSAAGKEIRVNHGDSHPIMADWEGTRKPGLVVGCGDGSVLWFRNEGSRKEPKLAAPVTLVSAGAQGDPRKASKEAPRGTRAKVCVVDWNGDGLPDLLVGDFGMTFGEEPRLSEADRKHKKEVEEKLREVQKELRPWNEEINKIYQKADTRTAEGRAEVEKKTKPLMEKYKKPLEEQSKLYTQLRKYQRPYSYHGQVWLFLRQPAERTAASR